MISIDLHAKIRNAALFLRGTGAGICSAATILDCDVMVTDVSLGISSAVHSWGRHYGGDRPFPAADSCARAFPLQESVHRHSTPGKIAQPLGELQGSVLPAGKEIAKVPFRTIGRLSELADGHSLVLGPAKHGMWF